jgi:hypothetical protein
MFENQCAQFVGWQFVGCLFGSALNRGLHPFYANGNPAGSSFKKALRSLRKWMADGRVFVALYQGATDNTKPSKLPPFWPLPVCLPEHSQRRLAARR